MNLAIYVKPGQMLGEVNDSNGTINWKQIKPLIIKNVLVLSKKRKKLSDDSL